MLHFLRSALVLTVCCFAASSLFASTPPADVIVQGPAVTPKLMFACCDQGVGAMESLFADPHLIVELKELHAGLGVAISDLSPQRAQLVRRLNQAQIPVIAWLLLPPEQGYYFNAKNAPAGAARFAAFDAWSHDASLRWDAVGLDIEPDFGELAALKGHGWRLFTTLFSRAMDSQRVLRARQECLALIGTMRSRSYFVQTYQMPFLPAERKAHSDLLDRLLGTVDVPSDQEVLMLYTSYAHQIGAAMIWKLGPDAQAISVGSTDGDPNVSPGPLNWSEFSRDLIVAGHFSHLIGVYNLEGCVRQNFLPRLLTMNWSQSVTIPAAALQRADRLQRRIQLVLWIVAHLPYLITVVLLLIAFALWRWRINKRKRRFPAAAP